MTIISFDPIIKLVKNKNGVEIMRSKKIMLTSLATFTLVGTLALSQTIFADTASSTSGNSTAATSGTNATTSGSTTGSNSNTTANGSSASGTSSTTGKASNSSTATGTATNSGKANSATTDTNKPEKVVTKSVEWRIEEGKKYLKVNGVRAYGKIEIDGNNYLVDWDGSVKVGLLESKETRYYFDKEGVQQLGWHKINGKDYYLTKD